MSDDQPDAPARNLRSGLRRVEYLGGGADTVIGRWVEIGPFLIVNAAYAEAFGLAGKLLINEIQKRSWVTRLVWKWPPKWLESPFVWNGFSAPPPLIGPGAPRRWAAIQAPVPDEIRIALGDPAPDRAAQPGPGVRDTPPRMRPPKPGTSFEAAVDRLIWEIEGTLKILHATGTPAIATGPCAFWRPAPTYSAKRNKAKARAAKKAVGKGKGLPGPYPRQTQPLVFEPLPQKRTRSGAVDVADSAVVLVATLILSFTSWPHEVEEPAAAPYPERAAPKPTKGKGKRRKGMGRKPPLDMICAAVEQQITAEAKKAGFEVPTWFTPELHDAIERVHCALMRHNIAASQSAFLQALKLGKHPNHHDAEDLDQRTKIKALDCIDSFAPWAVPNAWMNTACRNEFLNDVKEHKTETAAIEKAVAFGFLPRAVTPADQDRHMLALDEHSATFDKLPRDVRTALAVLAMGYEYKEVAERLNIPLGTLYSRVSRAREKLQGTYSAFEDPTVLPQVGGWVGRRVFDSAVGFDDRFTSERVCGKSDVPGFEGRSEEVEATEPTYGPGRIIPVTLALNAYYKRRLKFAHWRHQTGCYTDCSCAAEVPPIPANEGGKRRYRCIECGYSTEVRPPKDGFYCTECGCGDAEILPRHRYRCIACERVIDPLQGRVPHAQRGRASAPWRLPGREPRTEAMSGFDLSDWFHCKAHGGTMSWLEFPPQPPHYSTPCVRCYDAPDPFPPPPPGGYGSRPSVRVRLRPQASWIQRVSSAWVEEYTPAVRSNLGAAADEASVMDMIEKSRELPKIFQKWVSAKDEAVEDEAVEAVEDEAEGGLEQ